MTDTIETVIEPDNATVAPFRELQELVIRPSDNLGTWVKIIVDAPKRAKPERTVLDVAAYHMNRKGRRRCRP